MWSRRIQRGFTLIEMIVAIVILGIGLAGVLIAYSVNVRNSADALVAKQLTAIAETMMEEILLKPFKPPIGSTGAGSAGGTCAGHGSSTDRSAFDEVSDYNGYQTQGVCDIDGDLVPGLNRYRVSVAVVADNSLGIGAANTYRVTVTASHLDQTMTVSDQTMVLDGFKVLLP